MIATTRPLPALTASELMSRDVVTISQDMPLHAAAELFCRRQIGEAAVVDADGRCIGMLSATDLLRWALQGAAGTEDVPPPACPYQVKGRLLTGADAVICTRAPGSCPLQEMRPMTGGRHTAVCRLQEGAVSDWADGAGA
jgi:CBS-domain-containing membrane protein